MKNIILSLSILLITLGCTESKLSSKTEDIIVIDKTMYENQAFNTKANLTEKEKFGPNFLDTIMKKVRKVNWSQANDYCKKLNLGGYSDWKLPTHKELEKISNVDIYYGLGNYTSFDDYAKQHLENAKKHVKKIKQLRTKSSIGSELIVKEEFLENMPLINDKNIMGEFWTADERDEHMAMTLDFRNAVAWWTSKSRSAYVLCYREE
jgi:hypothetical protein